MVGLHKVQFLWPQLSPILYIEPSRIIALEKDVIMFREGTTQGDNLAMLFYAIEIMPLLRSLKVKCPNIEQIMMMLRALEKWKILKSGGMS